MRYSYLLSILIVSMAFSLIGCKKTRGCTDMKALNFNAKADEEDGSCDYLEVGDSYQGGYIAYIYKQGDPGFDSKVPHGIIVSPNDLGRLVPWTHGGKYNFVGAVGSMIGDGKVNTKLIVDSFGVGIYAARICYDLVVNGYDDWCLPSNDEWSKIYTNKEKVGGFAIDYYWSSTEFIEWYGNGSRAWVFHFGGGVLYGASGTHSNSGMYNDKSQPHSVRAIRYF